MIPTIENILKALFAGDMDVATASRYIATHIALAEQRGAALTPSPTPTAPPEASEFLGMLDDALATCRAAFEKTTARLDTQPRANRDWLLWQSAWLQGRAAITPTAPQEAAGATGKQALQVAQEADALREAPAVSYTEREMYEMQREGTLPDVQAWLTYCKGEPNVQPELRRRFGWCQFHTPVWMPLVFQRAALAQHQPQQGEQHGS